MIECVCIETCHLNHESGGRPTFYERGQLKSFESCPAHFAPVAGAVVPEKDTTGMIKAQIDVSTPQNTGLFDFATASEEVLMAATDYDLNLLKDFGIRNYGAVFAPNDDKAKIVAKFVDARYRDYQTRSGLNTTNLK